tara:strand:+ start:6776 stop:8575 length:1800 start_codon:yes stop_codon:yes gene_type:complete
MPKKLRPIDYTSRDFASIRRDLENYAKRYYPDTYKDFNQASFGSLMLDTVAYIGDILSFYVDYQTNESFLDSAVEYNNVMRLARQLGFKLNRNPSSYGILSFYVRVPASAGLAEGPDYAYAPVLQAGSLCSSLGGGSYTLLEDVDFAATNNQVVVGDTDQNGTPIDFIIRAQGKACSGQTSFLEVDVGGFQKFLKVNLQTANVAEIVSVLDSEGHEYVEVDHLSQNVIYKGIRNVNTATNGTVASVLKAVPVVRRFVVEHSDTTTFLQFGYGSDSELLSDSVADPTNVVLELNGRDYVTDLDFDPTKLISTDKFGIAPANTTLRIGFRVNTTDDVNAGVQTITSVDTPRVRFTSEGSLVVATRRAVISSLEVTNEEPFVGSVELPNSDEIKQRVLGFYAAQNRAVTLEDYQAISYGMPGRFGMVKRCAAARDFDELRRNINLYVISEDTGGKLQSANITLKNNLKNWLLQYKIVNDTIDILDATIINFGINYVVVIDSDANRFNVINQATEAITKHLNNNQYDIAEDIIITDFYKVLQKVKGIVDVVDLEIVGKNGTIYSAANYDFEDKLTVDGRKIKAEQNTIFELKFPNLDIKGSVQ